MAFFEFEIVSGALRSDDVRVGQHIGISPGAVPRFMEHFEQIYSKLGRADTILAAAAAHHRLAMIFRFLRLSPAPESCERKP